jgi:PAS domain S-box-containing protein
MTPEKPKGWILVVDDTEAMRYATSRMLRGGGYEVVEAATGLEALEQAKRLPDLVVLDIHLPDIDGYEVCRHLKNDTATKSIPVLHLTATFLESEDRAISLDDGADAFLKEPVEPRELLATVRALLRMKRAEKEARQTADELRRHLSHLEEAVAERTSALVQKNAELSTAIAVQERTEKALRLSEETYRGLFDNMWNGLAYCRVLFEEGRPVDCVYLDVNRAFEKQTGLSGVAGRRVSEVIPGHWESNPDLLELYGRVALTGKPEQLETYVEALDDWYSLSVYSPQKEHIVAVFDVITERKKAALALRESHDLLERRVDERTAQLRESEARFRTLFERHSAVMLLIEPESGTIVDANEAAARFYGYGVSKLRTMRISEINTLPPEQIAAERARAAEEQRNYFVFPHRLASGEERIVEVHSTPIELGGVRVLFSVIHDITERKQAEEAFQTHHAELEEQVKERTASLAEANAELEAFSYSVSHELRTPLRAIDGYSAMIAQEYVPLLDDEGRRLFGQVRWNAQRMGQLIDDLLAFSRAGRADLTFGDVDMAGSAKAAFAQVVPDPDSRSRISLSVGGLPQGRGDPALLRRVWENLLSNAVKFSSGRERPEIRVEGSIENGEAVYRVRDNGVGFDMKYVDKLFGVFQRLQGTHEFEGTGVGLAVVRRVVVRHGGRVWAEAELGRGATFSFTLASG